MLHVSHSRVDLYLTCPYAHYLRYVEKLKLKRPVRPLSFGKDFHALLQYRSDKAALKLTKREIKSKFYELPASWQRELGDDYVSDLKNIFGDYSKLYKDDPLPHVTEQRFEIPLGKFKDEPIYFVGVIDELYKRKVSGKKTIIVGEHKTFSRKPDISYLMMNPQKCLYAKAVQFMTGALPEKVIWDYIKSTPAAMPKWLEPSKRFSLAANQNITPFSWRRACKLRGVDDPEELTRGNYYAGNIPNFFFKLEMDVIPDMVDDVFEGFLYTSKDIAKQGHKNKTKHVTRNCNWCNYCSICNAELTGGNRAYIIEKEFVQKPTEHDDQEDSIAE